MEQDVDTGFMVKAAHIGIRVETATKRRSREPLPLTGEAWRPISKASRRGPEGEGIF